jgi:hypothetical protein
MTPERQRVEQIRARVAALGDADWQLAAGGEGMLLDSIGTELGAGGHVRVTLARFTDAASSEEMELAARAPGDLSFLLGLFDRAVKKLAPPPPARPTKNHAAEAAIRCGEAAFKRFLIERHGLESPASDERTAQHLRGLLGVSSRREINDGGAALDAWKRLRGEYEAWRRAG